MARQKYILPDKITSKCNWKSAGSANFLTHHRSVYLGLVLPHSDLGCPISISNREITHRHAHRPVWWRSFLNCDSLSQDWSFVMLTNNPSHIKKHDVTLFDKWVIFHCIHVTYYKYHVLFWWISTSILFSSSCEKNFIECWCECISVLRKSIWILFPRVVYLSRMLVLFPLWLL